MPLSFRTSAAAIALASSIQAASTLCGIAQDAPAVSPQGQRQIAARDELNRGVDAYKAARYGEAIDRFRRAVALAPSLAFAKLYLGTALAQNVVPGLDTPENLKTADEAVSIFLEVLQQDPQDSNSMKQIAGIYFQTKKLEDAKLWQKKVLEVEPKDADAAYTIGVIDWTLAHQSLTSLLATSNVQDDGEGNRAAPAQAMNTFREKNAALVEEGILYLNNAIEDRPNYANAMAYLNLVYRLKASVDRGDDAACREDLKAARDWASKGMDTHRVQQEQQPALPR